MLEPSAVNSRIFLYYLHMKCDLAKLKLGDKYNFINGTVSDHLCETCAFLDTYTDYDCYYSMFSSSKHFVELVWMFEEVNKVYSDLYLEETGYENPIQEDCKNAAYKARKWLY